MADQRFNPWLYEYYARYGAGQPPEGPPSICFVIGSPDIGGGTNVILQHARYAQRQGCAVTVVALLPAPPDATKWHPAQEELRFATFDEVADERFDIAIATWWPTVLELPRLRFRQAAYFVQSIESRFYAADAGYPMSSLAELTYTVGLPTITIALWIQTYLAFEHSAPSFLVHNGIDKSRYQHGAAAPHADRVPGRLRILIEGPVDAPMKGVGRSIELARAAGAAEVWLLTSSGVTEYEGCDRVFSRIPMAETPAVYASCDVLLKLSQVEGMFGPPLEMFHTGGTVVTADVTGHDEYVIDGVNGLVVRTDDDAATVSALRSLHDSELLSRLQAGAARTASRWPDWEESSWEFLRVVNAICKQDPPALLHKMLLAHGARATHHTVTGVKW